MHRLLKRQLKKSDLLDGNISKNSFNAFCSLINQAYIDTDNDRKLQQNILETSSREMRQLYENMKEISEKDPLTHLLNRYSLEKKVNKILSRSCDADKSFALCFIDIDNFKKINDTLGHDIGDKLIIRVANVIAPLLNPDDIFARLGGDEFVIVFRGETSESDLSPRLDVLMEKLRCSREVDKYELEISVSIGVCLCPADDQTLYGLMKKADVAMYRAKSEGRDNYIFYSDTLNQEKLFLEQSMPTALKNNEFELFFQPIVNSNNNAILGAETLIRWRHPSKGMILPNEFISLAENSGFIVTLGSWVIKECCKYLAQFSYVDKDFYLSVNVSMRQFANWNIYTVLKHSILKYGVNPNQLAIEVTETIMQNNIQGTIDKINKIKSLGVKIYLDDFGTGYSSLSYLNKLNVDVIKIDKSFVDEIKEEKTPVVLLNTIISMGASLKKKVIAEGVENDYQVEYLLENGCTIYQGYNFSKPIPEAKFVKLLSK